MGEKGQLGSDDPRDMPVTQDSGGPTPGINEAPCRICGEPRGNISPCPHCGME